MRHAITPTVADVLALLCMLAGVFGGCFVLVNGGSLGDSGLTVFVGALISSLFIFD